MATKQKLLPTVGVISGNFLEMFDFIIYGIFAAHISRAFFPGHSEYISMMLVFMTFGAGFLMRPIGALVMGSYIDQVGRKKGLVITLGLMAAGTALIAFVPDYATIGIAAPILVVTGRLLQGFSAGVELGGASIYLSEVATDKTRGFWVSWQSGTQQLAVITAAVLGYAVNYYFVPETVDTWAWRIPFFVGCLLIPVMFWLRSTLEETEAFKKQKTHPTIREIFASLVHNWKVIGAGVMMIVTSNVGFYAIMISMPIFGKTVLHLTESEILIATFTTGLTTLITVLAGGAISDRVGRLPVLVVGAVGLIIAPYPIITWMVGAHSFASLVTATSVIGLFYGIYNGGAIVALTEVMPKRVKTVGFSLAYAISVGVFGGFTPAFSTWLVNVTGNSASYAIWVSVAALIGLGGTLLFYTGRVKAKE